MRLSWERNYGDYGKNGINASKYWPLREVPKVKTRSLPFSASGVSLRSSWRSILPVCNRLFSDSWTASKVVFMMIKIPDGEIGNIARKARAMLVFSHVMSRV